MALAQPPEMLDFLDRAHKNLQALSTEIRFDKTHPRHRSMVSLYGSILELTSAIKLLLRENLGTGVPILLRSILEAYVDLFNLADNPRYGYALELAYIREWLRILEEAKAGKNDYLSSITTAPDLDETISEWQRKKKQLERDGHRPLKQEEKFRRAQMEKEYKSIYNSLCCDAHNNLRALVGRHLEIGQTDFDIVLYKGYGDDDFYLHAGMLGEMLLRASERTHDFFSSPAREGIQAFREEFDAIRAGENQSAD